MRYDIVAVLNDQKLVITMESDDKDLCASIRKGLCALICNQCPNVQLLEVKEG